MNEQPLTLAIPVDLVEAIAARAAEVVLERLEREGASRREPRYVTVEEAAELYRCKPQRIYELLSAGRLTRVKEGGRVLLLRAELEERLELGRRLASRRRVP